MQRHVLIRLRHGVPPRDMRTTLASLDDVVAAASARCGGAAGAGGALAWGSSKLLELGLPSPVICKLLWDVNVVHWDTGNCSTCLCSPQDFCKKHPGQQNLCS